MYVNILLCQLCEHFLTSGIFLSGQEQEATKEHEESLAKSVKEPEETKVSKYHVTVLQHMFYVVEQ